MNTIILVIPTNMKSKDNITRVIKSVDLSSNIYIYLINQSEEMISVNEVVKIRDCNIVEVVVGKQIPLSEARNIALKKIYKEGQFDSEKSVVLFTDDDAWFPKDTIDYLLHFTIKPISLRTIDPAVNKSFKTVSKTSGEVRSWHVVADIVSICFVAPLNLLKDGEVYFNGKLGLGNRISQGEESLFLYELYKNGMTVYYDEHLIYHPYKKSFSEKNFYSLAYFWSACTFHLSILFFVPFIKNLCKYTIAILGFIKDLRYINLFMCVWKGTFDGIKDKEKIFRN